jgi:hypothetical protein
VFRPQSNRDRHFASRGPRLAWCPRWLAITECCRGAQPRCTARSPGDRNRGEDAAERSLILPPG